MHDAQTAALLALQTKSFAKSDAIMSRTVSTAISLLWTEDQIKEKGEKMLAAITKVL
jgi:8-amino-3,8-dideoxy-alpha-D-manno-octulosonate transaminase